MVFVVWWTSLCWKLQLKENFEKLRRRTTVFTSTDIQLRTLNFAFFVTSLPWMHGLRTDFMIWVFLWNFKPDANFLGKFGGLVLHCFAGNTGRLDWQTSFYLQIFSSGVISNFLKFLGTALQYLWSSPREQLQLKRSHLVEDHQLQTERVKKPHSDFWLRWNSEKDFKEKLQSSRSRDFEQGPHLGGNSTSLREATLWRTSGYFWQYWWLGLRRPTEGWTLRRSVRCFQLSVWTIHFYFPMWRKLMETYWRISHSRSTLVRQWLENFGRWWIKTSLRFLCMREGWLFMFTCVTLQFKVCRFTSDISHRSLFHCSSEPLNGTSLSADFKHSDLKLPMQLGYYIFERNFEGRHQLLSQLFCIDVSCRLMYRQTSFAKICSFRIRFKFSCITFSDLVWVLTKPLMCGWTSQHQQ